MQIMPKKSYRIWSWSDQYKVLKNVKLENYFGAIEQETANHRNQTI